jgi:hypothetical protein
MPASEKLASIRLLTELDDTVHINSQPVLENKDQPLCRACGSGVKVMCDCKVNPSFYFHPLAGFLGHRLAMATYLYE